MLGWIVAAALFIVLLTSKRANTLQRTHLANLLLLFFLAPDAYDRHRKVFHKWLSEHGQQRDTRSLWLHANNAVERMARNWASEVPSSLGVAQLLWQARGGGPT